MLFVLHVFRPLFASKSKERGHSVRSGRKNRQGIGMTKEQGVQKLGNRWGYLIKGFIMTMFLGILYAWSIFVAPLEQAFGWDRAQTTITYSIMMVTFALGQLTGGLWASTIIKNPARTITLFSFLLAVGFYATREKV